MDKPLAQRRIGAVVDGGCAVRSERATLKVSVVAWIDLIVHGFVRALAFAIFWGNW